MTTPAVPLRIGFVPGVTLTKWRTVWAERFRGVPLEVVEVSEADQRRVLDAGEVDACFCRLPVDPESLHLIRLYEEQPVVWAAKDHPVSLFDELTLADLADEVVLTEVDGAAIDRVADAEAVLRVPLSVARTGSRRDFVHRPVTDAEPTTIVLAWRRDREHDLMQEFVGVVRGRTANSSRGGQPERPIRRTARKPAATRARRRGSR